VTFGINWMTNGTCCSCPVSCCFITFPMDRWIPSGMGKRADIMQTHRDGRGERKCPTSSLRERTACRDAALPPRVTRWQQDLKKRATTAQPAGSGVILAAWLATASYSLPQDAPAPGLLQHFPEAVASVQPELFSVLCVLQGKMLDFFRRD